ncbi:MAG TPA: formylglycine-generating enzyme family protein [Micromonosporaceae bacterium]
MAWVPGGTFPMGSDDQYPEEAPAHLATVGPFWIDQCTVTNAQFAEFVAATGHRTLAEQPPDPAEYPDADPALLVPGSALFVPPRQRVDLRDAYRWWVFQPGADWRHPRGPGSGIDDLWDHPVVHVAYPDAMAYAAWEGKDLPTEAEWECAARGGGPATEYAWGEELTPGGRHLANVWQGEFPLVNLATDGFAWTAPVGSFPANGYGLYDMIGNVWEWTRDAYGPHRPPAACCAAAGIRTGHQVEQGSGPPAGEAPGMTGDRARVIKGGSFLCAPNYCRRYRPAARLCQEVDTSTCHLGFRCVLRPPA